MIWLKKKRENTICKAAVEEYMKDSMETFDDYLQKIQSIQKRALTTLEKTDIQFHLYQLMEIYVDAKIVSKWLTLDSELEKIVFFRTIVEESSLKAICNFEYNYYTKIEYDTFPNDMKNALQSFYEEVISDFHKVFAPFVVCLNEFSDPFLSKGDFLDSLFSFYLNQGFSFALGLHSLSVCTCQTIEFNGEIVTNYDCIYSPLFVFDKNFVSIEIQDNCSFYKKKSEEAFLYFIRLAKQLYANDESTLNSIVDDVSELKATVSEHDMCLHSLEKNLCEEIKIKHDNINSKKRKSAKEMIEDMKENENYCSIIKVEPNFEKYCFYLMSHDFLYYDGECIHAGKKWKKYYFANFIYDTWLFNESLRCSILNAYMQLCDLPLDIGLKPQYGETYKYHDKIHTPLIEYISK